MRTAQELGFTSTHLGGSDNQKPFDTTGMLRAAVNDALRDVAAHVGIMGYDTITVTSNTYVYTLNDSLIEGGLRHMPVTAMRVSANGKRLFGMVEAPADQFGVLVTSVPFGAKMFRIEGNQFWINDARPAGDKIYVYAPVRARMLMDYTDVPNVNQEDRSAVVYRAAEILGDTMGSSLARANGDRFRAHVLRRGGALEGLPVAAP